MVISQGPRALWKQELFLKNIFVIENLSNSASCITSAQWVFLKYSLKEAADQFGLKQRLAEMHNAEIFLEH